MTYASPTEASEGTGMLVICCPEQGTSPNEYDTEGRSRFENDMIATHRRPNLSSILRVELMDSTGLDWGIEGFFTYAADTTDRSASNVIDEVEMHKSGRKVGRIAHTGNANKMAKDFIFFLRW